MIYINIEITNSFMKEAVPMARKMEGNWAARMKIALNSVIINHYLNLPLSNENVNKLLRKGVSYRRICRHYSIGRKEVSKLRQTYIV
ncbi:hypothetical protein ABEY01_17280 [Bacillus velezensis]|uniref:hypothetical protein n=1 Tax=Bacillus velezensis TaxID=492670 RepID=UPI000C794DC2|nr:hypothetical protein [Bacillus velezensis]AUJ61356.1 hypothetical protein B6257_12585 [Bacillus velezensis]MCY7682736.1 hypothetical protein [Bacillus velezensis]MEC2311315.1 hypothetical protein [Bacillus velezensis]